MVGPVAGGFQVGIGTLPETNKQAGRQASPLKINGWLIMNFWEITNLQLRFVNFRECRLVDLGGEVENPNLG